MSDGAEIVLFRLTREGLEHNARAMGYKLKPDVNLQEVFEAVMDHSLMDEVVWHIDNIISDVLEYHKDVWLEPLSEEGVHEGE